MGNAYDIEIAQLRKVFVQKTTQSEIVAIDALDLTITQGEIVAIVGPTGCGKSTLFDLIIGLDSPTSGTLLIGGSSPSADFEAFRGRIATVFQQDRLLPWRTALDNVCLPLELLGLPLREQHERAIKWLDRLGLGDFKNAYPRELSGGMRQRVAISRAFALQAGLLLADESFSALDAVTARELRGLFVALARESGSTAILITHQLEEAVEVGERILVFGKAAQLLGDVQVNAWHSSEYDVLYDRLRKTIQSGQAFDEIVNDKKWQ